MKEGDNRKNYGNTVVPKITRSPKSLKVCFELALLKRPKIQALVCLVLDEWFANTLPQLCSVHMEEKTYPAMDFPV